jgi:hypothetical protein
MAGNRVEELEQTVRELEATVSGLTDELVETKERLRTVEDGVGTDIDDVIQGQATRSAAREPTGVREPVAGPRRGARQGGQQRRVTEGPASQEKVEQAVEAADGEVSADEDKGDEVEGEDDGSETDDIIVA